ncbi:MAG: hypothetical protein R3231_00660 [bacterium]|nr:hypothetical protein [bacterium]
MKKPLERFKPAVEKRLLLLLSGIVWIAVGAMLLSFAYRWLSEVGGLLSLVCGGAGLMAGLIIHHFGFLKVVDKNLGRILPMQGKQCLFAFQSWRSYFLIVVMMAMGVGLRHSRIPKPYLASIYIGIGMGLILSSLRYLRIFMRQGA